MQGLYVGIGLACLDSVIALVASAGADKTVDATVGITLSEVIAFYFGAGALFGAAAGATSILVSGKKSALILGMLITYAVMASGMVLVDLSALTSGWTWLLLFVLAIPIGLQGTRAFSPYWKADRREERNGPRG